MPSLPELPQVFDDRSPVAFVTLLGELHLETKSVLASMLSLSLTARGGANINPNDTSSFEKYAAKIVLQQICEENQRKLITRIENCHFYTTIANLLLAEKALFSAAVAIDPQFSPKSQVQLESSQFQINDPRVVNTLSSKYQQILKQFEAWLQLIKAHNYRSPLASSTEGFKSFFEVISALEMIHTLVYEDVRFIKYAESQQGLLEDKDVEFLELILNFFELFPFTLSL